MLDEINHCPHLDQTLDLYKLNGTVVVPIRNLNHFSGHQTLYVSCCNSLWEVLDHK